MQKIILAIVFSFSFAVSAAYGVLAFYFSLELPLWYVGAIGFLNLVGLICLLAFKMEKPTQPKMQYEVEQFKNEIQKFQREFKAAIRGHLKVSLVFWIHIYRKEKVKSFDDAKKEVFQDLKREFAHVRWMQTLIEDIRQEFAKSDF